MPSPTQSDIRMSWRDAKRHTSWVVSPTNFNEAVLDALVTYQPLLLCELGAGLVGMSMAKYKAALAGVEWWPVGKLDDAYLTEFKNIAAADGVDITDLSECNLLASGWYDSAAGGGASGFKWTEPKVFDLIVVDGPPGAGNRYSSDARDFMTDHSDGNTIFCVDDIHTPDGYAILTHCRELIGAGNYAEVEYNDTNPFKRRSCIVIPDVLTPV